MRWFDQLRRRLRPGSKRRLQPGMRIEIYGRIALVVDRLHDSEYQRGHYLIRFFDDGTDSVLLPTDHFRVLS